MKQYLLCFISLIAICSLAQAQIDTLEVTNGDQVMENVIEDLINNQGEDVDFELNTTFEILEFRLADPLDLNRATREQLAELGLLDGKDIEAIINYREETGDFIAIYELQSVLDLATIERIKNYVKVRGDVDDFNVPIGQMMVKGSNTLYLRYDRVLEEKKGYTPCPESDPDCTRYLGDPNRYIVRFRHQFDNKLSYGITTEKDPGEEFFAGSNKTLGFDFLSFHWYLKDYSKVINTIALGDFSVNMGQGLIMFDGFGGGKSSFVTNIKKYQRPLRPYTSIGEFPFKRGGGITLNFGDVHFTAFGSYRGRDANISITDTLDVDAGILEISSLQTSGLHRTQAEIDDKNSIQHTQVGGILKYQGSNWHIAFNGLYDKLSSPLLRNYNPYNRFYFNGDRNWNASADYSYIFQNFHFFGETAMSRNGGIASVNGLMLGLDKSVSLAVLHRYLEKDYQALTPNVFAEGTQGQNENGLYLGLEFRPNYNWQFVAYFDAWKNPWLRFGVDAPAGGHEYFGRITYQQKRRMRAYFQYRQEVKAENFPNNETNIDYLTSTRRQEIRLHVDNKISKALELRNRVNLMLFEDGTGNISRGYLIYQDIIFKPMSFPLHFSTRFAIFQTDDFDSRIYAYENDILYSFAIPAYYNKGTRFYLNLRYRGIRNTVLELRFAQTYFANADTFGSGLEEIDGKARSEVRAQIKYKF